MEKLIITGGKRLEGTIRISGAKNAVLPIIAGALLTKEEVILNNVPALQDVRMMAELAQSMGAKIRFKDNTMHIRPHDLVEKEMPESLAGEIRTSSLMIGALLHRLGKVRVPLPGGCVIGTRKIDLHIIGLNALGAEIEVNERYIEARTAGLNGADITLEFPSVGATENTMIAACLAEGASVIRNAAKEPEIVDLANFLNSMGAEIKGAGTDTIKIHGVENLSGTNYSIIPDRINTGTYMVAAAITGGNILLENTDLNLLKSVVAKLREIGVEITETEEGEVNVIAPDVIQPANVTTEVYPGFPTDMQPIITPLLVLADGESMIKETIFDNRFNHVPELRKMGADIEIEGDTAIVNGVDRLRGAQVTASDLRAGAALVLAGLAAKGETVIDNVYQIDRGYKNIDGKLRGVGAEIKRRGDN
ncbi:MAG: UDP-N-acetylglucosamine 1-carboxyvinyltransferase [Candidatus Latescibacterota bacterium]|nr:MAG: UDP-N-acetylglucosamine 1-carboxyvinyltransferase [Candidatus Latescibacterota bacterium]